VPVAVETFVKSPKQERRVNRLYEGCAGVPGYGGAAKKTAACAAKTAACAAITHSFAVAAFHGVVGVFVYRTIARCMDVDAVLEPYVGDAVTIAG